MGKKYSAAKYIVIFVIVQFFWLALMGLWIARFVSNHMVIKEIGERYAMNVGNGSGVAILIIGLVLLVAVLVGGSILFRYLNFHFRQTRLYDNFIANITHELKTPLTSIQLILDTIKSHDDIPKEKNQKFISQMQHETTRLNKMISSILEVGGMERQRDIYSCNVYRWDVLAKDIIENARDYARLNSEQLIFNIHVQEKVVADRDAIRVVFENLIENSIKYSSKPVKIEIADKLENDWLILNYRDYGIGVEKRELKKIFKKFYRVNNPADPSVKGTGLGLYWLRSIIRYHGGKIAAHTPAEGDGLAFEIKLPIYGNRKKSLTKRLLKT